MSTWTHECSWDGTTKNLPHWDQCPICNASPTIYDGVPYYDVEGNLVSTEDLIAQRDAEDSE